MKVLTYILMAVLVTVLTATNGFSAVKGGFSATLSGDQGTPRVKTSAKGDATFTVIKNGHELSYKLTVTNIENVTAAHIHKGKKGMDGPPVAGLFAGPKKVGTFNGALAEGVITEKDLMGNLAGKQLNALIELIKSGGAYVNVHTDQHPEGELRGQIK